MKDREKFWSKMARKYAASPIKDQASYDKTMDRTRSYLKATDQVLELGSGTGSTALLLSKDVKAVHATDLSSEMIAIGKERAEEAGVTNLSFQQGAIQDIAKDAKEPNAVMAFNLLHLVDDLKEEVRTIHGMLPADGLFISKSLCLDSPGGWKWRLFIIVLKAFGLAPPVNFFSIEELDDTIRNAGFKVLETGVFPQVPPARFVVAKKI